MIRRLFKVVKWVVKVVVCLALALVVGLSAGLGVVAMVNPPPSERVSMDPTDVRFCILQTQKEFDAYFKRNKEVKSITLHRDGTIEIGYIRDINIRSPKYTETGGL
jgi:hypothetical protein